MVLNEILISTWAFLFGFLSAVVTTGPLTFLVFQNALLGKYKKSFLMVLGAAVMESIYCAVALIFIGAVFLQSEKVQIISKLLSTVILFSVAIYLFTTKNIKEKEKKVEKLSLKEKAGPFIAGFVLIAINPSIILTWGAAFTVLISFNTITINSFIDIILFVLFATIGVIFGGLAMMGIVKYFKPHFSEKVVQIILKFLGAFVICIALYFFFDLLE